MSQKEMCQNQNQRKIKEKIQKKLEKNAHVFLKAKKELPHILITASGMDSPGITAGLMKIISLHHHELVDIGQAVTNGLLSLTLVISPTDSFKKEGDLYSMPVFSDLLLEARKLGIQLDFKLFSDDLSKSKKKEQRKFILSCVAQHCLSAHFMADLASLLSSQNLNIARIDNICSSAFKALEFSLETIRPIVMEDFKPHLHRIGKEHQVDLAFLQDTVFRRNKRMVVFDMDSTLIQVEVIDEMAKVYGKEIFKEVQEITKKAMQGELDFTSSFKARLALLEGLKKEELQKIAENLPLTPGAKELIDRLKELGYKTAIISGGMTFFAKFLQKKLGIDYAFANEIEIKGGEITGKAKGQIIHGEHKAFLLEVLAQQENISLEQVVAIGDGANDLPMLSKAGLGIAFHAKEIVKKNAEQSLNYGPLSSILYFLGLTN